MRVGKGGRDRREKGSEEGIKVVAKQILRASQSSIKTIVPFHFKQAID